MRRRLILLTIPLFSVVLFALAMEGTVRLIAPELRRPIGIIHRQRRVFTPTASKFVEVLQELRGEATDEDD